MIDGFYCWAQSMGSAADGHGSIDLVEDGLSRKNNTNNLHTHLMLHSIVITLFQSEKEEILSAG